MTVGQRSAADSHDLIEVRGARENNLADISLDIPKHRLTVFTGVSGSGKSSLVFGTIAAGSQRLINETYTAFIQSFMPSLGRPDVDALRNLSAAIVVDQERMGAPAPRSAPRPMPTRCCGSSSAGSAPRTSAPRPPSASTFPKACAPNARGLGRVSAIDVAQLLALLDRLVDDGNTVIVIEHHQAVMAYADWLIDLGPGAGQDGGRVVFTGTPADLIAHGDSLTAQHLRTYLTAAR